MKLSRNADQCQAKGWRWHFEISHKQGVFCLWAPSHHSPLIYWVLWGWRRIVSETVVMRLINTGKKR